MRRVGVVVWRGMVGAVLPGRMHEANDYVITDTV